MRLCLRASVHRACICAFVSVCVVYVRVDVITVVNVYVLSCLRMCESSCE